MKIAKRILSFITTGILICTLCMGICMQLFPEFSDRVFGYRTFTVLTDSMDPIIPVGSLVVSKTLQDFEEPNVGDVITFRADRFGTEIVLTHYFAKQEVKDGITYYRTQAYNSDDYDFYETEYSDILGIMEFHVPYIGKFMLFLGSPYGLGLLIFILVMITGYSLAVKFFDLDSDLDEEVHFASSRRVYKQDITGILAFENLQIEEDGKNLMIKGDAINISDCVLRDAKINLIFCNQEGDVVVTRALNLIGKNKLCAHESAQWNTKVKQDERISDLQIQVVKVKK